jgi:hypothetical protein
VPTGPLLVTAAAASSPRPPPVPVLAAFVVFLVLLVALPFAAQPQIDPPPPPFHSAPDRVALVPGRSAASISRLLPACDRPPVGLQSAARNQGLRSAACLLLLDPDRYWIGRLMPVTAGRSAASCWIGELTTDCV